MTVAELCWMCGIDAAPPLVWKSDSSPLCKRHWNWWLVRYLNSDDEPPCSVHLITESPDSQTGVTP